LHYAVHSRFMLAWPESAHPRADSGSRRQSDFQDGFWHGQLLVETELYGEAWAEQYSCAATETARLTATNPVTDPADIPF
jgi:hypothetical protein